MPTLTTHHFESPRNGKYWKRTDALYMLPWYILPTTAPRKVPLQQTHGFVMQHPGYGMQQPVFVMQQPGYGLHQPSFGAPEQWTPPPPPYTENSEPMVGVKQNEVVVYRVPVTEVSPNVETDKKEISSVFSPAHETNPAVNQNNEQSQITEHGAGDASNKELLLV
ncbi:hypothetical protein DPMN_016920 [Dreissena polymorpha]|uniref:Uncharacterized protein n=1 Tax=Dreissena polymorpha TaxID=45954 RepID=A0A9D4NDR8_DREPO|nr:hypothetical protein DPMN_016920 [Dreissena polymorpha]